MPTPRVTKKHDHEDIRPEEWKSTLKNWFRVVRKQGQIQEAEYLHAMRIIDTYEAVEALVTLIEREKKWDSCAKNEEGHATLIGHDGAWSLREFGLAILDCAVWATFRPREFDPRECRRLVKALRTVKEDFDFLFRDKENEFERVVYLYESIATDRQGGRPVNMAGDALRLALAKRFIHLNLNSKNSPKVVVNYMAIAALFRATFPRSRATEQSVAVQLARKLPE